jgi:S-adenosylmethionine-dependent methyltransferase
MQEFLAEGPDQFDLVLSHAVLEWLSDPRPAINQLARLVASGGRLSLMFYNRNAVLLKRVLRGEFEAALPGDEPRADKPAALDPDAVRLWLRAAGLRVDSTAGIRLFHDHLPESLRQGDELERLMELETAYRKREPFSLLGQHVHYVCSYA